MAEEYKLEHLKSKCKMVLLRMPPRVKNLAASDLYKLKIVHLKCMEYAEEKPIHELAEEEDFEKLKDSTLVKLVYPRVVALEKSICGIRDATQNITHQMRCLDCSHEEERVSDSSDDEYNRHDRYETGLCNACGHYDPSEEYEEERQEWKCDLHYLAEDVLNLIPKMYR